MQKKEEFTIGDKEYLFTGSALESGSYRCAVAQKGAEPSITVSYLMTAGLKEQWGLDAEEAQKFLSRFAGYHMKSKAAKGEIGIDAYLFDVDFAGTKPETVIENMTKEWESAVAG